MLFMGAHRINHGTFDAQICRQIQQLLADVLFAVEEIISQMLVTADLGSLHAALQEQRLAQVLFEELDFLGQVPKADLPAVRAYLHVQEPSLREVVERLVKEPDNDAFREQLCQPLSAPSV